MSALPTWSSAGLSLPLVSERVSTLAPESLMLDVTRLLSAGSRQTPTGIERVEMAYAQVLLAQYGRRVRFARRVLGRLVIVPSAPFARFVIATRKLWQGSYKTPARRSADVIDRMLLSRAVCLTQGTDWNRAGSRALNTAPLRYLLVSHANLHVPGVIQRLKASCDMRLICMLHDLIPYTHPEFSRPAEPKRHEQRLKTLASEADLVITNSDVTRHAFQDFCKSEKRKPRVETVPLGVDLRGYSLAAVPLMGRPWSDKPYFVVIGTIEPRKNHLLLLNIWIRLVQTRGADAPHLIVIGRRGWENENILDILDRGQSLAGKVHELSNVPDKELWSILQNARALLFPSFVEGYGLPLAESLAAGTPVICSDIPVFREIGGDVPCYIDPIDGMRWLAMITRFSDSDDLERSAQVLRGRNWQAPRWKDHFNRVWQIVEEL